MFLSKIFKFIDFSNRSFRYIGISCIVIVSILLFIESVTRLFWNISIITVDEIGGIGMYMFVVFNIAPLYRRNQQLSVRILVSKLSKKAQHILAIVLHIFTALFASLTTYLWWKFIFIPTYESARYLQMSRIVEWPFHLIAIVCWAMLFVTAIECLLIEVKNKTYKENWGGI